MNLTSVVSRRFPMLAWLGVDRTVGYLLLTRIVQMASFPVSMIFIARYFSAAEQGYYYTFFSILALQALVDLGLAIVIINSCSHEWAFLQADESLRITGDPAALSRLVSLGRVAIKWYSIAALVFVFGAGSAGLLFFSQQSDYAVNWQAPWVSLVILTGLMLCITPFNAILEGCNQIAQVNRVKLEQVCGETAAILIAISLGAGLWCAAVAVAVRLTRNLFFVFGQYRNFFAPFWRLPAGAQVNWFAEIWPMQWRLGVSGLVTYFLFGMFNPVMFHYHGAIVAGQTGMTLQMITGLQVVAMSWVSTKVPSFGALIATKQYSALDHLWRRVSTISLGVILAGSLVLWLAIYLLKSAQLPLAQRVLDPLPTMLFLIAACILQFIQCLVSYLRAHRKEPIMMASVTTCLATGGFVWLFGSQYGPVGAAAGYLLVTVVVVGWYWAIWVRCRREWHVS